MLVNAVRVKLLMNLMEENLKKISDDREKITKKLDKHIAVFAIQNKYLIQMLQRHDRILYGDNGNSAGFNVRGDRIDTSAKFLSIISWSGLMAVLDAFATFFSWNISMARVNYFLKFA